MKPIDVFNTSLLKCLAYRKFLRENKIGLSRIDSVNEFKKLPLMDKKNYVEKYPLEERLLKDREPSDYYMICTSSGSTGEPTVWPRDYEGDEKAINFNDEMFERLFDVSTKRTLVVVTFGLGAWTAGMLTSRLCWEISRGKRFSVVTPGLDKMVTLKIVRSLSKYYDQTIITGYPPFIVEFLEYAKEQGFNFKKNNFKIHYTSARVSEAQREKIAGIISKSGSRENVLGFYACSEFGIIGIETSEAAEVLKYAWSNPELCKSLFGGSSPPALVEYNPQARYIEISNDGHIIITAMQPVPLVRFDMNDRGGLLTGEQILERCARYGCQASAKLKGKNFVFVFGRADAVRLLCNIYVDDVIYALENSHFSTRFTGNFQYGLTTKRLKNYLKMIIFLKEGKSMTQNDKEIFAKELYNNFVKVNPDFRMVQEGIDFKEFEIDFEPDEPTKYLKGKLKHFL